MVALIWIFTLLGLGLWTALAFGLHWLLNADPAWATAAATWLTSMPGAPWLESWWPGWEAWVVWVGELLRWALAWAGPVAVALVWVAWGLLALPVLALAFGLTWFIRRKPAGTPAAA
jgi:hypothetical protein